MGGSISAGADNDEMIDNLIKSRYIRTNVVEKVFRSVDRAFYFLAEFQHTAYRDLAWKQGNLHLSAPCIYSEVLEHLKLEPGHSFLNIGSGTGYLSTLAGLILGPYGTNHGVEVHADVVEYAYEKLEQFKKTCSGVDVFEFCEPVFVVGNAFNLNQERRYDRIYCGAACPEAHQEYIKKFMKVGGILVLPCEDDLLKIIRTSEGTWEISSVLPVSFSTLQFPDKNISSTISMPEPEPLRLQEICRSSVRSLLRSLVETEEPELTQKRKCKQKSSSRKTHPEDNCVVIPVFEDPAGIESAFTIQSSRFENFRPVAFERLIRNLARNYQNLNDNNAYEAVSNVRRDSASEGADVSSNFESVENETSSNSSIANRIEAQQSNGGDDNSRSDFLSIHTSIGNDFEDSECTSNSENSGRSRSSRSSRSRSDDSSDGTSNSGNGDDCQTNVRAGVYSTRSRDTPPSVVSRENSRDNSDDGGGDGGGEKNSIDDNIDRNDDGNIASGVDIIGSDDRLFDVEHYGNSSGAEINTEICMTDLNSAVSDVSNEKTVATVSPRPRQIAIKLRKGRFATKIKATKKHCSAVRNDLNRHSWKQQASDEGEEAACDRQPKKVMKREKLDSGISEESDDSKFSASNELSFAECTSNDPMEIDSDQDSDFTEDSSYEENSSDVEPTDTGDSSDSVSLKYRTYMEKKIQSLPLPKTMKCYLNYGRDFLASVQ